MPTLFVCPPRIQKTAQFTTRTPQNHAQISHKRLCEPPKPARNRHKPAQIVDETAQTRSKSARQFTIANLICFGSSFSLSVRAISLESSASEANRSAIT